MLGPHVIGEPASLLSFVTQSQPAVIKYLNPDKPNLSQAPITIGRIHTLSEEKDMANPFSLAQRHADALTQRSDETGITLWEGINEPPVWNGDDYIHHLCDYEWKRTEILNQRDLHSVVLNLSVGWPRELGNGTIDWEPFGDLLKGLPEGNYLGLHEYWYPTGPLHQDSRNHRAGRLFRCPYNVPILVTECGVDIGGGQGDGWVAQGLSVEQYITQLAQYRDLISTDDRVKGATIFTYGNMGSWSAFDIEPWWSQFVPVFAWQPEAPTIETPIRVLHKGEIVTLELEEYLRSVVPTEMYPVQWPASSGLGATQMEALKAQAVASRSYAVWRIQHPRSAEFDLYGDEKDQGYDPSRIHPNTDRAVRETVGIIIDNVARYVSKCGQASEICSYCQGQNGFDNKVWTGRLCQYGCQLMAKNGSDYRDILQHYYGDVKFSDEEGSEIVAEITIDKYPVPNTVLGLHGTPVQYHDTFDQRPFFARAKQAGVGWWMIIDDGGGSILQPSPYYGGRSVVDILHELEFEVIVRLFAAPHAVLDARMEDAVGRMVEKGIHYVFWQNEPECEKWYDNKEKPANWVEIVFRNWVAGAYKLKALGAYPGTPALTTFRTPDPFGSIVNPFKVYITEQERKDLFIYWYAWVNRHIYPIHHPFDYPLDEVNQNGKHLTHDEYLAAIAEVSQAYRDRTGEPWVWEQWEDSEHHINLQRDEGKRPGCRLEDDDVCWLSFTGTIEQMKEAGIADHAIMISTETGRAIGDKGKDGRYPRVTAAAQIRFAAKQLSAAREHKNLKALCYWLAACREMGAVSEYGFERQSWWTHEWDEVFDLDGEIPLVQWLVDNPTAGVPGGAPTEPPDPEEPEEENPVNEPELINDAVSYGVTVEAAEVLEGSLFWKCTRIHHLTPEENNGNHNVYCNVLVDGEPAWEVQVQMFWPDGTAIIPLEKPYPAEPMGNGVLTRDAVGVTVLSELDSDRVVGLHTNHGDEKKADGTLGNSNGHHSFLAEWTLCKKATPPEPPTPPETGGDGCNLLLAAISKLLAKWATRPGS